MNEELTKQLKINNDKILATQDQIAAATVSFQTELKSYQEKDREIRDAIALAMQESGTKSFENDFVKLTFVAESSRTTIDVKAFEAAEPELAQKFKRTTPVKSSVRIAVK